MLKEKVILVDDKDREIGEEEKIKAHRTGKLHRAFSVFIFNSKNELLLQKRAKTKYHSGGLWTNTCCGHPRPGEETKKAAQRRLKEETGIACPLKKIFAFKYRIEFKNGLTENEFDHVFIGFSDKEPKQNPKEFSDLKWLNLRQIKKEIKKDPHSFTYWFKDIFRKAKREFNNLG